MYSRRQRVCTSSVRPTSQPTPCSFEHPTLPTRSHTAATPEAPPHCPPTQQTPPVLSLQRETRVLDLFISLKVREDVWLDDSELHLERDESFRDLFDLMQPKSRMEDLVRVYGVREGVVSVSDAPVMTKKGASHPLCFDALSVSFSSRRVGVVLTKRESKRTIVEVSRTKDEKLEAAAKRLVQELRDWVSRGH